MLKDELITIIIPTFNRAHLIKETLNSVKLQTYTNWECIIIDDGSTDNTLEIINSFLKEDIRFKYYVRPSEFTKGPSGCRNYGFIKSKGDYVIWFDDDDVLFKYAFECYYKSFTNYIDAVVAPLEKTDESGVFKIGVSRVESVNLIEDYLEGDVAFYVSGPMWRRSFLMNQPELFDENLKNLDDWDFNLRMLYSNPKIHYLSKPLAQYRIHSDSLSHEINRLNIEEIKSEFIAREKHLKLLVINGRADSLVLKKNIIKRYKYLLREALVIKHKEKYYLFKKLCKNQLEIIDFKGLLKTITAYITFICFNKGYKFFK